MANSFDLCEDPVWDCSWSKHNTDTNHSMHTRGLDGDGIFCDSLIFEVNERTISAWGR